MKKLIPFFALLLFAAAPAAGQQVSPPGTAGDTVQRVASLPMRETSMLIDPLLQERPPLSGGRIAAQTAAGFVGGIVGAGALSLVLLPVFAGEDQDGWEALGALALGVAIGYPVGATGGVYLVGQYGNQTGSFLATLGGAALGAAAGIALGEATGGLSYVVLVPAGAVTGFNLTRRYRRPPVRASAR